jgi:hypothetical protein
MVLMMESCTCEAEFFGVQFSLTRAGAGAEAGVLCGSHRSNQVTTFRGVELTCTSDGAVAESSSDDPLPLQAKAQSPRDAPPRRCLRLLRLRPALGCAHFVF